MNLVNTRLKTTFKQFLNIYLLNDDKINLFTVREKAKKKKEEGDLIGNCQTMNFRIKLRSNYFFIANLPQVCKGS